MGGTPLRREYRETVLAVRGPGGGERSKRGGTKVGSRVSLRLRLRLPWTEARRRMEERAAAVGSAFTSHLFFLVFFCGCSSGSRQMLRSRFGQWAVRRGNADSAELNGWLRARGLAGVAV